MSFATAVQVHNAVGFILIANYLVWLGFYLFTDKITVYHPELNPRDYFRDSLRQMLYYGYGIFQGDPNPHHATAYRKFNAAAEPHLSDRHDPARADPVLHRRASWDLERFRGSIELFGGVRVVATVHVLLFIFFVGYILVHPYLASLGGSRSSTTRR